LYIQILLYHYCIGDHPPGVVTRPDACSTSGRHNPPTPKRAQPASVEHADGTSVTGTAGGSAPWRRFAPSIAPCRVVE
jgi:hypothetical protein